MGGVTCFQRKHVARWQRIVEDFFPKRGRETSYENSFPKGVNAIPDGTKQFSQGGVKTVFLPFQRGQNGEF